MFITPVDRCKSTCFINMVISRAPRNVSPDMHFIALDVKFHNEGLPPGTQQKHQTIQNKMNESNNPLKTDLGGPGEQQPSYPRGTRGGSPGGKRKFFLAGHHDLACKHRLARAKLASATSESQNVVTALAASTAIPALILTDGRCLLLSAVVPKATNVQKFRIIMSLIFGIRQQEEHFGLGRSYISASCAA